MEAATRERRGGGRIYDAVVLDAPPTGRITRFLNVNSEVAGLARMGPVRQQADSVMNLLRSNKTAVHLVTVLEEMPVQETIDAVAELRAASLPTGGVIVNMMRTPLLPAGALEQAAAGDVDLDELSRGLKRAGIDATEQLVNALAGEAIEHARRVALEDRERALLRGLNRPMVQLPLLPDAASMAGLYDLAQRFVEAGVR
jgi:anion-transporting  ArsA/GET3 family ATPase